MVNGRDVSDDGRTNPKLNRMRTKKLNFESMCVDDGFDGESLEFVDLILNLLAVFNRFT